MIRVSIGPDERSLNDVSGGWIAEQVGRRREQGGTVCIRVTVQEAGLNVVLATAGCPGGGGSRPPTDAERRILELWRRQRLDEADFPPGRLMAFLQQLRHAL